MNALRYMLILIGLAFHAVGAQDRPPFAGQGDWGAETAGVACRITTDRAAYAIGEPVSILVEVRNGTDRPIALGLEPLIAMGQGKFSRQPAAIQICFAQEDHGRLRYFNTSVAPFPAGTEREAQALVVEGGKVYSTLIQRTPWGLNIGSFPAEPQPGPMKLSVTVLQYLSSDLMQTSIQSNKLVLVVANKT